MPTLEKSLREFGLRNPGPIPFQEPIGEALAGWMEPRYTLLLRTLLEGRRETARLPGIAALLPTAGGSFDSLRRDIRLRFAAFRDKWTQRLDTAALLPFLQRNQWIVAHAQGGVALIGKGVRKEARLLYLQTLHDMVSDCARQWSGVAGRLHATQEALAADWQGRAVRDDETRMLPALEASLRFAEFEVWKTMRLSLGDIAEEAFRRAVSPWEGRVFARPETLVRDLLTPWRRFDGAANGFIGMLRAVARMAEDLALAMADHYDRKWELYLRGFAETI